MLPECWNGASLCMRNRPFIERNTKTYLSFRFVTSAPVSSPFEDPFLQNKNRLQS